MVRRAAKRIGLIGTLVVLAAVVGGAIAYA